MPIRLASPPQAGLELVSDNVPQPDGMAALAAVQETLKDGELVPLDEALTETFAGLEAVPLTTAAPHAVYTADSQNLEAGLLASARLTAWQYVVFQGDQVHGIAEIAIVGKSRKGLSYATYYSAEYGQWMVDTVAAAERLASTGPDYELRILRVPALSVLAVWLHDQEGQHDRVLPVVDVIPNLNRCDALDEGKLLEALKAIAANRRGSTVQAGT